MAEVTKGTRGLWVDKGGAVRNAKAYGVNGNGSADNASAFQDWLDDTPAGGTAYLPEPDSFYAILSEVTIPHPMRIVGAGSGTASSATGTHIQGEVDGYIFKFSPATGLKHDGLSFANLNLRNTRNPSAHGAGDYGCIYAEKVGTPVFDRVNVYGSYRGITLKENIFGALVTACNLKGSSTGQQTDGWGLYTAGHSTVQSCDITAWDNGIRLGNASLAVIGGRIETNAVGIFLGKFSDGTLNLAQGVFIAGINFEANDTAIHGNSIVGGEISGCFVQGTANAPNGSGESLYGLRLLGCENLTVSGVQIGGSGGYLNAGVSLDGNVNGYKRVVFQGVNVLNSVGSGDEWSGTPNGGVTFINCNRGALETTLTNNDTTPTVRHTSNGGADVLFLASNSNATTISDFDDGLQGVPIRIIATNTNTTLEHGTNILLRSGANKNLAANEGITLIMRSDDKWYEV